MGLYYCFAGHTFVQSITTPTQTAITIASAGNIKLNKMLWGLKRDQLTFQDEAIFN